MRIECIAIGTELLTTSRVDTNSVWLAQRLASMGMGFHRKTVVGDSREDLRSLFVEALGRSDLILCTGGLGPTFDDFTKELLAEVIGAELIEDSAVRQDIEDFYAKLQRPMPMTNLKQALIPVGATTLRNPLGTAPGIYWENPKGYPGRRIVLLPGVPKEMKGLWENQVEPRLRPLAGRAIHSLRMLVGSVGESALEMRTTPLRQKHDHLDWTILASLGVVELIARSTDPDALESARIDFEKELGADLICTGNGTLESTVIHLLRQTDTTLSLAESMTAGLVASRIGTVPGASDVFKGGAVTYSAHSKIVLAGVDADHIQNHGTVSEPITREMAERIRKRLGTTWSLAITGNAGPTEDKNGPAPLGTSIMAVAGPAGTEVITQHFPGERGDIQARTTSWALDMLRRQLLG